MEELDLAKFQKKSTHGSSKCLKIWNLSSLRVHKVLLKYSAKSTVAPSGKYSWASCMWNLFLYEITNILLFKNIYMCNR